MLATIKEYLSNASIHGLRYMSEPGRSNFERAIWLVFVALSWAGTALLMLDSWTAFQNDAISFTVDTAYLDWDTDFPSVTFCENDGDSARAAATQMLPVVDFTLNRAFEELAYFKTDSSFIQQKCFEPNSKVFVPGSYCPLDNLREVAQKLRNNCSSIFAGCSWNNVALDCCKYFRPLHTEFGLCYSINNQQAEPVNGESANYPLVSNRTTGPGTLRVELFKLGQLFWHSHLEIPNRNTETEKEMLAMSNKKFRRHWTVQLSVLATVNDPALPEVSLEQRNCRFPHENYLPSFPLYSSSACVVECRKRHQMELCNCTSHNMPPGGPYRTCDLVGLLCVSAASAELGILKSAWGSGEGVHCPCHMSCLDIELRPDIAAYKKGEKGRNTVDVKLASLPTVRYRRNVVRGVLDLVVSMGGTAGLFMGASLLSFVELLYFLLVRAHGNARLEKASPVRPLGGKTLHAMPTGR